MEKQSYFLALMLPFVFLIFICKHFSSSHQNQNSAPTPPSLPIIGHLHLIKDPLHLSLTSLSRRYGPIFSLRLGCKSFLMVSSPSALEECFTKNDVVLANRPTSMAGDWLTYNYAVFTMSSYGDLWRILRKFTVVELFSSQSLQKSAKIREQEILKLVRVLHKDSRKKVDLNNLIYTYSFNIVMRAIAGKPCVGEEEIGSEAGKEILSRTRTLFSSLVNVMLGMCDYFPFLRWIGYKGMEKHAMLVHEKRDEFLQHLIDEIRTKNNAAPAPAVEEEEKRNDNLIEALLSVQASEPDFYSDRIIKSILLVMMAAGTDTIGMTLEWAMSHLLRQPEEMQKLRQEINQIYMGRSSKSCSNMVIIIKKSIVI